MLYIHISVFHMNPHSYTSNYPQSIRQIQKIYVAAQPTTS